MGWGVGHVEMQGQSIVGGRVCHSTVLQQRKYPQDGTKSARKPAQRVWPACCSEPCGKENCCLWCPDVTVGRGLQCGVGSVLSFRAFCHSTMTSQCCSFLPLSWHNKQHRWLLQLRQGLVRIGSSSDGLQCKLAAAKRAIGRYIDSGTSYLFTSVAP